MGRIFDARTGRPIGERELLDRLRKARILMLGEVHDNPDHHRIQAWLLRSFARARRRPPAVVYEMISTDKAGVLSALRGARRLNAGAVFDIVDWDHSGWPSRRLYEPVMRATVEVSGLPVPAGVPRELVRKVSRAGLGALSRQKIGMLALGPLTTAQQASLEREIIKSHCDMIPARAARAMSAAQRLRDAQLASVVADAWERTGAVVLIAGDGHVRKDRGAPLYLRRQRRTWPRRVERDIPEPLVVWMAEAKEGARTLADLLPDDAEPADLADIFIVTPRAKREDPCAGFARFMEKKRHHGKEGGASPSDDARKKTGRPDR